MRRDRERDVGAAPLARCARGVVIDFIMVSKEISDIATDSLQVLAARYGVRSSFYLKKPPRFCCSNFKLITRVVAEDEQRF